MGAAKNRKAEIAQLKAEGVKNINSKNFAINFKFKIAKEDEYQYNLLAVYTPLVVKQMRDNNYDNDKCLEIVAESATNLLVAKAGNANLSDPKQKEAVEAAMRNTALAVLKMQMNDAYRTCIVDFADVVLHTTLKESSDGRIGFDLIDDIAFADLVMMKGIKTAIDNVKQDGVDFMITVA